MRQLAVKYDRTALGKQQLGQRAGVVYKLARRIVAHGIAHHPFAGPPSHVTWSSPR